MEDQNLENMLENEDTKQVVDETEPARASSSEEQAEQKESDQDRNFANLREARIRAERERDEAIRYIQQLQSQTNNQPQTAQQIKEDTDDDFGISDDDLVEGRHFKNYAKKIRQLEKELKDHSKRSSEQSTEAILKARYNDFDSVVTQDNINQLRKDYPEVAESINSSNDLYNKAVSAYTLIKRLGIHKEDLYTKEKEVAGRNSNKPRPLSSISPQQGDSPLSHANAFANGLTDTLKAQLLKEMNEAAKKS
jgi:hypothetical protein